MKFTSLWLTSDLQNLFGKGKQRISTAILRWDQGSRIQRDNKTFNSKKLHSIMTLLLT